VAGPSIVTDECYGALCEAKATMWAFSVSQTLLVFLRGQRHLEWFTRESMHHLAVLAVVPGSELAGGLMDVVLRELWK